MERTKQVSLHAQMKQKISEAVKIPNGRSITSELIPMGSTLLNLAMSGTVHGGAKKGTMINIIGASHGGKSILALTAFAEAASRKRFDTYALIYDDVERANSFDMEYMFGVNAASRITPPRLDKDDNYSCTVQHLQANVMHWLRKKVPFIYVLDSFDALDALEDQKKVEEMSEALEKDKKDIPGTYGMAKAKAASSILRGITSGIADTNSALFIISQTRDNVDPRDFQKTTRSGGRALKFYAHHELWLSVNGSSIKKKDTVIGNSIKIKISKNKITGKQREVKFDIYYDYGIDDIGSCIDYLIEMKRWTGGGAAKINHNGDFKFEPCTRAKIIAQMEDERLYTKLQSLVQEEWDSFEESIRLNRKSKYT